MILDLSHILHQRVGASKIYHHFKAPSCVKKLRRNEAENEKFVHPELASSARGVL